MKEKIVFFNTGWMDFYKGLSNDTITGGGKNVGIMGWGGEMLNFLPFKSRLYGYVQPKIDKKYDNPTTIKLEKLGATEADESIDNVTVVWTATDPDNGGTYIIGWYKKATIFRYYQSPPNKSKRNYKGNSLGYFVTAKASDAKLLSIDERNVRVLRQKKNWMGQSNVWYAEHKPEFVKLVKAYIFSGIIPKQVKRKSENKGGGRQLDILKRIEVEKKAVLLVTKHYEKLGFHVRSVEKDNVGWDLTATNEKTQLKLEIKGLSGKILAAELTPNEFKNLNADTNYYRLCIVTDALVKPILKIFAYSKDNGRWMSDDGEVLKFEKIISAKVYL